MDKKGLKENPIKVGNATDYGIQHRYSPPQALYVCGKQVAELRCSSGDDVTIVEDNNLIYIVSTNGLLLYQGVQCYDTSLKCLIEGDLFIESTSGEQLSTEELVIAYKI